MESVRKTYWNKRYQIANVYKVCCPFPRSQVSAFDQLPFPLFAGRHPLRATPKFTYEGGVALKFMCVTIIVLVHINTAWLESVLCLPTDQVWHNSIKFTFCHSLFTSFGSLIHTMTSSWQNLSLKQNKQFIIQIKVSPAFASNEDKHIKVSLLY